MPSPYRTIYERLAEVVNGTPGVRAGNKPGALRGKTATAPADFIAAELRVRPAPGGSANPRATSSSGVYVQNFTVEMATDQEDPGRLFDVKWLVLQQLYDAGETLGLDGSAEWAVFRVSYPDLSEAHDNAELNRGRTYAWSGVISVSVEFGVRRDTP